MSTAQSESFSLLISQVAEHPEVLAVGFSNVGRLVEEQLVKTALLRHEEKLKPNPFAAHDLKMSVEHFKYHLTKIKERAGKKARLLAVKASIAPQLPLNLQQGERERLVLAQSEKVAQLRRILPASAWEKIERQVKA